MKRKLHLQEHPSWLLIMCVLVLVPACRHSYESERKILFRRPGPLDNYFPLAFCEEIAVPSCEEKELPSCAALRITTFQINNERRAHCAAVLKSVHEHKPLPPPPAFKLPADLAGTCNLLDKDAEFRKQRLEEEKTTAQIQTAKAEQEAERTERQLALKAGTKAEAVCTASSAGSSGTQQQQQQYSTQPQTQPSTEVRSPVGASKVFLLPTDILFELSKADLTKKGLDEIKRISPEIVKHPGRIRVDGHTDSTRAQSPNDNWQLSAARARAVLIELIKAGVRPSMIYGRFFAEHAPLDVSSADDAKKKNRRVEIVLEE